ncbi:MAG: endonuclease/exonuclease/phosphatase family protein [Clostridia bacterium]|nr:endonuclease/exonuclease/phosphatase family protein [Clostridia bacterium]
MAFREGKTMKIMSFNTQHCKNFLKQEIDFEIMAKTIVDLGADVVGLNEIYGGGTAPEFAGQTERLSELTGLKYYFFAPAISNRNGNYGNALISRIPIVSAENIPIPDPEDPVGAHHETRCVIKAGLENGLCVMVSHFGLNPDEQKNAASRVVKSLEGERCVFMGDLNVTPDDPVLTPIRERMFDTAELFDGERLSFPSDKPRIKIDYIFTSPDIKAVRADIPAVVASDHRPYVAEIEL